MPPRSPDGGAGTCGQALAAAGGRPPAVLSGSGSAARLPAVFPLQPLPFRAPLPRFPAGCETPRSRSLQRSASRCCCPASASLCRPVSPQLAVPARILPSFLWQLCQARRQPRCFFPPALPAAFDRSPSGARSRLLLPCHDPSLPQIPAARADVPAFLQPSSATDGISFHRPI